MKIKKYITLSKLLNELGFYQQASIVDKFIVNSILKLDIPENIKKLHTKDLYHIRWPHGKEVVKDGFKSLEELDKYFPLSMILKPHIPSVDPQREDTMTPRVSFSTTLAGAVGSLAITNNSSYIGIYKPAQAIDVYVPSNISSDDKKFYVHDAEKWNEVWSLRPVEVELQKIIRPGDLIKL